MQALLLPLKKVKESTKSNLSFNFKAADKIVLSFKTERIILSFDQIVYATSYSNYCMVHLKNKSLCISKTLKWLQEKLDKRFIRVHSSNLVNLKYAEKLDIKNNMIHLLGGVNLAVSRSNKKNLLALIK